MIIIICVCLVLCMILSCLQSVITPNLLSLNQCKHTHSLTHTHTCNHHARTITHSSPLAQVHIYSHTHSTTVYKPPLLPPHSTTDAYTGLSMTRRRSSCLAFEIGETIYSLWTRQPASPVAKERLSKTLRWPPLIIESTPSSPNNATPSTLITPGKQRRRCCYLIYIQNCHCQ